TPASEDKYKEGLEWHPDGQRLNYMYYGPEKLSAQIRCAYLDGRAPELILDQPDHWYYVGVWSPDGSEFHFISSKCNGDDRNIHIYQARSGEIKHAVRNGFLPVWSADGKSIAWTDSQTHQYFEVLENHPATTPRASF